RAEHSLEVHLPFLQVIKPGLTIVPLAVGDTGFGEVGEVIDHLWDGRETLIIVSSDLSHSYDYATARRLDAPTARAIEARRPAAASRSAGSCRWRGAGRCRRA